MQSTTSTAPALAPQTLLQALRWRYATKRFDPAARLDPATWDALEQALVLAPSSYGLQPWRFFVVDDPAVRATLKPAAWNQPQITDAAHLVVFAYKKGLTPADTRRHVERTAAVRGVTAESLAKFDEMLATHVQKPRPFDADEWARRQVYLALGQFLAAAALLGVDACPMEGFDPARFDQILGLERQGYASVVLASAGRRHPDDAYARHPKVRFERAEVVRHI